MNKWAYVEGAGIGATWDGEVVSIREHDEVPWIRLRTPELSSKAITAMSLGAFSNSKLHITRATKYYDHTLGTFLEANCVAHLDLSLERRRPSHAFSYQGLLETNTSITSLKAHIVEIDDETAVALGKNTTITKLNLLGCKMYDFGVYSISRKRNLHVLNVSRNNLSPNGAEYVARIGSLTELNISCNKIWDRGACALCKHESLKTLIADNCGITQCGIEPLAYNTSLTKLKALNNQLESVDPIYHNTTISSLNVLYNGLRLSSLATLASNPTLTELRISCDSGGTGSEAFDLLANNTHLKMLDLALLNSGHPMNIAPLCKTTSLRSICFTSETPTDYELVSSIKSLSWLWIAGVTTKTAEIIARNESITWLHVDSTGPEETAILAQSTSVQTLFIGRMGLDVHAAEVLCANTNIVTLTANGVICKGLGAFPVLAKCPFFTHYDFVICDGSELPILLSTAKNQQRHSDLSSKFMVFCAIFARLKQNMRNKKALSC